MNETTASILPVESHFGPAHDLWQLRRMALGILDEHDIDKEHVYENLRSKPDILASIQGTASTTWDSIVFQLWRLNQQLLRMQSKNQNSNDQVVGPESILAQLS